MYLHVCMATVCESLQNSRNVFMTPTVNCSIVTASAKCVNGIYHTQEEKILYQTRRNSDSHRPLTLYSTICILAYRIAGNFRGAHISRITRMGSNSRTLKSPKLISSLKVGVVYLLARVASQV